MNSKSSLSSESPCGSVIFSITESGSGLAVWLIEYANDVLAGEEDAVEARSSADAVEQKKRAGDRKPLSDFHSRPAGACELAARSLLSPLTSRIAVARMFVPAIRDHNVSQGCVR